MLDISFGEIALIGVVALVVLGPERLPTVARTVGALVARAQRFVANVKADIQREANLSGLDTIRQDIQSAADTFKHQLESEVDGARQALAQGQAEAQALASEASHPFLQAQDTVQQAAADCGSVAEAARDSLVETTATPERDENQLDLFADPPKPAPTPTASSRE